MKDRPARLSVLLVFGLAALAGSATVALAQTAASGSIEGRLVTIDGSIPLGNVLVYLAGTAHADTTDIDGLFQLTEIPEGQYDLLWHHPELADHGITPRAEPVRVQRGQAARVTLHAEVSGSRIVGCEVQGGAVSGVVRVGRTGTTMAGAVVRLLEGERERATQRAGLGGRFLFCGLAAGSYRIAARLLELRETRLPVEVTATGATFVEVDLLLADADPNRPARLLGRILDASTGEPIAGAEVRIAPGAPAVLADRSGGFHFADIAPGTLRVLATQIGYREAEGQVEIAAGETVRIEVRMSTTPLQLDPITVTATRQRMGRMADFQFRRARGWGTYVMRNEIVRRSPARLTQMVEDAGMAVVNTQVGTGDPQDGFQYGLGLFNERQRCAPMVFVDGIRLTYMADRSGAAAAAEAADALNMIHPLEVEGMEIYTGASQIPAEFGGYTARCGVVAVWTRGSFGADLRGGG